MKKIISHSSRISLKKSVRYFESLFNPHFLLFIFQLDKNALRTDQIPVSLPDYPSDRRSLIALEIFTTERSYVRQLEIAIKVFDHFYLF